MFGQNENFVSTWRNVACNRIVNVMVKSVRCVYIDDAVVSPHAVCDFPNESIVSGDN